MRTQANSIMAKCHGTASSAGRAAKVPIGRHTITELHFRKQKSLLSEPTLTLFAQQEAEESAKLSPDHPGFKVGFRKGCESSSTATIDNIDADALYRGIGDPEMPMDLDLWVSTAMASCDSTLTLCQEDDVFQSLHIAKPDIYELLRPETFVLRLMVREPSLTSSTLCTGGLNPSSPLRMTPR